MAFTPEQLAKIRQKENSLPAAFKRTPLTNYREGYFFITLNTRGEAPILSYLVGRPEMPDDTADAPHCVYTELGSRVVECWRNIPHFYPFTEILGAEAMPDHLHGLIHLKVGGKAHLGQIIRGFMIGCTHAYWNTLSIIWQQKMGVITAENRLLQISPWSYEYNRNTEVTRCMCMVMNELVRVIAGEQENWWKM